MTDRPTGRLAGRLAGRPVVIVGPTASGKSALAIELAVRAGGEIVNTDSVALYRGMDIGSAKPTAAERAMVPHHLVDVLDPDEEANVATFQGLAREAVVSIAARGDVPILVGGSSLYVRAVIDRLDFPGTNPKVRERWRKELELHGSETLHAELTKRDPAAAAEIIPTNGRRIVRALEVLELTGRPFAARLPAHETVFDDVVMIGLDVDLIELDRRIDARVDAMWEAGFVDEVRRLRRQFGPTAERALGYQQVLAHLDGECNEEEAREATKAGHRKFARRQRRMFRKDPRITWLAWDDPELVESALRLLDDPEAGDHSHP